MADENYDGRNRQDQVWISHYLYILSLCPSS